jgi:hypothetical protein
MFDVRRWAFAKGISITSTSMSTSDRTVALISDFYSLTLSSLARRSPAAAGTRRVSIRLAQSLVSLAIMVIL